MNTCARCKTVKAAVLRRDGYRCRTELPTKNGLCSTCYQSERRWRAAHDLPSTEEPAA